MPNPAPRRRDHLVRFYTILHSLERSIGGRRLLADCHGRMGWPQRGVYFFMEESENRTDSGTGLRVVRVGSHALTGTSRTTLWNRLSQHQGLQGSGGGNHRGSIFRLLVGSTLMKTAGLGCQTWGVKNTAPRKVRICEEAAEREVSRIIRAMPFLWLEIDRPPGLRKYVERNSIALLSNFEKPPLDPPSKRWRGLTCVRGQSKVRDSGLWNQKHVDEAYDPAFLDELNRLVRAAAKS